MTTPNIDERFERLAQALAPGGRLLRVWPLKGGISAEMTGLEIEHPGGRTSRVVVRRPSEAALAQNPQAAEHEFRLLQALHSHGLAVPQPHYLDRSGAIFGAPCLVNEYVDGAPEFAPADPVDAAVQLAEHLARIHSVDPASLGLSFVPQRPGGCAELVPERSPGARAALETERIRDALGRAAPPQPGAAALLHGDYWPGNVLWRAGRLAAVIDWEDAALGDPLADLAISRLDLLWIFGPEAMRAFTDRYRSLTAIDDAGLPYWDLCAALRLARMVSDDLAGWAAFFAPYGRHDITERAIREHYGRFVDEALRGLRS